MRRFLSLLLCVACLFSVMAFDAVSAEEADADKYISLLNSLGITEIKAENAQEVLRRDEFAYLIAGLATGGKFNIENDTGGVFQDVKKSNKYLSCINCVYRMGYMKGTGNGNFNPEGNLTTEHLTRILVNLLGYPVDDISEVDIAKISSDKKLYKNVFIADGQAVTLGEAAAVIANALDATMYYSDDLVSYYDKNDTLLNVNFGLYYDEGTFFYENAGDTKIPEVRVDDRTYEAVYHDYYDNINGYTVRAYIDIDEDKVVFADYLLYDNTFYYVDARDIISADSNEIKFYNDKEKATAVKTGNLRVMYNGKCISYSPKDFSFTNGCLVFVGDSSGYNAVIVNRFDTMVVGAVFENENTVIDYNDNSFKHKFSADAVFILNGDKVSMGELQKGDVLSIAYSKDTTFCTVHISREKVSGTVTEINTNYFVVNRRNIYRSDYFAANENEPKVGSVITLSVDYFGRAAVIDDVDTQSNQYAYFMDADAGEGLGTPMVQLYTADGNFEKYTFAGNVRVNGYPVKNPSLRDDNHLSKALMTMLSVDSEGTVTQTLMNDYVRQLIIYKLNSAGEINYIDTAIQGSNENEYCLTLSRSITGTTYKTTPRQFAFSYGISSSAALFYVPDTLANAFDDSHNLDRSVRSAINEDAYASDISVLKNDGNYSAKFYNVSEGGFAQAIVVDNPNASGKPSGSVSRNESIFIVDRVSRVLGNDDELTYKVSGYQAGKYTSLNVAYPKYFLKDISISDSVLETGDIIQISVNYKNEITDFLLLYDISEKYDLSRDADLCRTEEGFAYSKDDEGFIITSEPGNRSSEIIVSALAKQYVYVYDSETGKVRLGSLEDMITYDDALDSASKVFVRARYNMPQEFVIFN